MYHPCFAVITFEFLWYVLEDFWLLVVKCRNKYFAERWLPIQRLSLSNIAQNVFIYSQGKLSRRTMCVCVFWKCYHGLILGFRFDLCFYRDPLAAEIVQLMTETDRINISNSSTTGTEQMISTQNTTSLDILMPEGIMCDSNRGCTIPPPGGVGVFT